MKRRYLVHVTRAKTTYQDGFVIVDLDPADEIAILDAGSQFATLHPGEVQDIADEGDGPVTFWRGCSYERMDDTEEA